MASREQIPPTRFYKHLWEWVKETEKKYNIHDFYYILYQGETVVPTRPKGLEFNTVIFKKFENLYEDQAFVTILENGRFCGNDEDLAVITQENELIWEVSRGFEENPENHWVFTKKTLPTLTEDSQENIAVLNNRIGRNHNYFHWMFEVITKVELLRKSGIRIDKYIVCPLLLPFQTETLSALGIPRNKLLINRNLHVRAKKLVVPSPVLSIPSWACHFIKDTFLKSGNDKRKVQRIYVSRADSTKRRVSNEEEVLKVLTSYGFKKVELGNLSVHEQAQLFANAQYIVAPHGAGLTNLAFCRPGTAVLEFFSPYYVSPLYWIFSNRMSLNYYYLIGEGELPSADYYSQLWYPGIGGNDDITVNIDKLLTLLQTITSEKEIDLKSR